MAIFDANHPLATPFFIGYLIALSWLLTRLKFFQYAGLSRTQLIFIYILKIAAGIFYGWLGIYYATTANMTDTWSYHAGGLQEQHILMHDPVRFFAELIRDPYQDGLLKFLSTEDSYWNDLKTNAFTKALAILDLLTGGYYMVNVLFYNFLGMVGIICYYRVYADRYPTKKIGAILAVVLIPSVLFWTSGIHKEGILFTALGMIIYGFYFSFKEKKWTLRRNLMIGFSILTILILRNHLLFALLPALLLWVLIEKLPYKPIHITLTIYGVFISLFFLSTYIDQRISLPEAVARKQQEFISLKGKSSLDVNTLQPTPWGFLKNLPQSVDLALTRPHPSNVRHLLSLAAFLEVLAWGALIILWVRSSYKPIRIPERSLDYFMLAFSISMIFLIGFSINNLGAIARYRSLMLIPLLTPLLMGIDWKRMIQSFGYKL